MFVWDEDKVRFMRDASAYREGRFHAQLAARVAKHLPEAARVCDAGCGLGHLSRALLPYCRSVTALDVSARAADEARALLAPYENAETVCADLRTYCPQTPHDAAVFCFFGSGREIARFTRRTGTRCGIAVKKLRTDHRFSLGEDRPRRGAMPEAEAFFSENGIPFLKESFTLEFGQPLRSEADAVRFFSLYSGKAVSFSEIAPRLMETGDPRFPLYLPDPLPIGLLFFLGADVPETV